mmetsp:Transcript_118417/g.377445  ORF Transcript_118417/g.377445 Transcript_118417/m.377445 type:complete len:298 (+) Transcript_118417:39-932(+)
MASRSCVAPLLPPARRRANDHCGESPRAEMGASESIEVDRGSAKGDDYGQDMGLFASLPFCCGTNTGMLPCCERSGLRNDMVPHRPAPYPQTSGRGDAAVWHPAGTAGAAGHATGSAAGHAAGNAAGHAGGGGGDASMATGEKAPPGHMVEGEETYEDNSSYKGQLVSGRRHGRGVWTSPSEQYAGQWLHDQRDGFGKQTWQDGRVYEGQFKGGKFHDHGRMEWHMPAGLMVYEGQYIDDLKDGVGRYVWPDRRVYDGEWKRGMRDGRATYTNANGQSRTGFWKEDKVERWLDEPAP